MVTPETEVASLCAKCNHTPKHGHSSYCQPCAASVARAFYRANPGRARASKLKSQFGVSVTWYLAQFHFQGGVCGICKQPPTADGRVFAVDHDHDTGAPRGLLCAKCNGWIGSNAAGLMKAYRAVEYVRRSL